MRSSDCDLGGLPPAQARSRIRVGPSVSSGPTSHGCAVVRGWRERPNLGPQRPRVRRARPPRRRPRVRVWTRLARSTAAAGGGDGSAPAAAAAAGERDVSSKFCSDFSPLGSSTGGASQWAAPTAHPDVGGSNRHRSRLAVPSNLGRGPFSGHHMFRRRRTPRPACRQSRPRTRVSNTHGQGVFGGAVGVGGAARTGRQVGTPPLGPLTWCARRGQTPANNTASTAAVVSHISIAASRRPLPTHQTPYPCVWTVLRRLLQQPPPPPPIAVISIAAAAAAIFAATAIAATLAAATALVAQRTGPRCTPLSFPLPRFYLPHHAPPGSPPGPLSLIDHCHL